MTALDPHPELRTEADGSSFDALAADCAEVRRQLAAVPHPAARLVSIPDRAVAIVAGLSSYGD